MLPSKRSLATSPRTRREPSVTDDAESVKQRLDEEICIVELAKVGARQSVLAPLLRYTSRAKLKALVSAYLPEHQTGRIERALPKAAILRSELERLIDLLDRHLPSAPSPLDVMDVWQAYTVQRAAIRAPQDAPCINLALELLRELRLARRGQVEGVLFYTCSTCGLRHLDASSGRRTCTERAAIAQRKSRET